MKRRTLILGGGALATLSLGATATNASISGAVKSATDFTVVVLPGELLYSVNRDIDLYQTTSGNYDLAQSKDARVIGDAVDIIDGSEPDVPYLDNNSKLRLTRVGASTDQQLYPTGSGTEPTLSGQKSKVGAGKWPPATLTGSLIIAADSNQSRIIGIDKDGNNEVLASPGNGCNAISGVADINEDGDVELIFLDGSQQLRYLNKNGTTSKINNGSVGSNQAPGIGKPNDFGLGRPEVPLVDGSNNPALIDYQGNKRLLNSNGVAEKAPVAPVDINGDSELEFVFINANSGDIEYIEDVGGANRIETVSINGSTVQGDNKLGVASGDGISYDVDLSAGTDSGPILVTEPSGSSDFAAVPETKGNEFEVAAVNIEDSDGDDDLTDVNYEVREGDSTDTIVAEETVSLSGVGQYQPSGSPAYTIQPDGSYNVKGSTLYTLIVTGTDADGNAADTTVQDTSSSRNDPTAITIKKPTQDQRFTVDEPQNLFEVSQVQVQDNDGDDDIVEVNYEIREGSDTGTVITENTVTFSATKQYQKQNVDITPDNGYNIQGGQLYTLVFTGTDGDGNFDSSTVQDTA